ncbi:hypothetical protein M434DRAFT_37597 [Hypoxylon sp. CO27-5]|nr:hypothetical protein M434DRAFT_37597 [Hypoxylon sp. CO27-5]
MNFSNLPRFEPYEILGLSREASAREIKTRYQRFCFELHQDNPSPESRDKFARVQAAYGFLSDDELRSEYDEMYRNHSRHESGGNDNDPVLVGLKIELWAISRMIKLLYCLTNAETLWKALHNELSDVIGLEDIAIWNQLNRIIREVYGALHDGEVVMEVIEGALIGDWGDDPVSKSTIATIDRLWIRAFSMVPKLQDLRYVVKQLTDPEEDRGVWLDRLRRYISAWYVD